ncbi:MAG TPA: hypothetical protein DCP91_12840 [Eggerthellaceae bacterium]|nr:hypothetical protein [Eggerthellaceae bacterium]
MREKPGAPLGAAFGALALALVLVAAVVLGAIFGIEGRPATALAGPGSGAVLVVAAVCAAAWGVSAVHRCIDVEIGRLLGAMAGVVVAWLCLAQLQLFALPDAVRVGAWYVQCALPPCAALLFFAACLRATFGDMRRQRHVACAVGAVAVAACALLLFTNGFHQLAFVFDLDDPSWQANCTPGPAYLASIVLFGLLVGVSAVLLGLPAINRSVLDRIFTPVALLLLDALCCLVALRRGWGLFPDGLAPAAAVLLVLSAEICLDVGLFPAPGHTLELFRRLPFDLKILTPVGRMVYHTDHARRMDVPTLHRLAKSLPPEAGEEPLEVRDRQAEGTLYKLYRLNAGVALITEDAEPIDRMRLQLEQRQRELAEDNEVLLRTRDVRSVLYRQQRERELGERVERDLADAAVQIRAMLDESEMARTASDSARRIQHLNKVKVLVAYSKRKGMLALAAADSDTMPSDQLKLIAREAMADLKSIGIDCAIMVSADGPLSVSAVNVVYDSFYDCVLAMLGRANPVLMAYMSATPEGDLVMRTTIECAIGLQDDCDVADIPALATEEGSWAKVQAAMVTELEERFQKRGNRYSVWVEDGFVRVMASAPIAAADAAPRSETREGLERDDVAGEGASERRDEGGARL